MLKSIFESVGGGGGGTIPLLFQDLSLLKSWSSSVRHYKERDGPRENRKQPTVKISRPSKVHASFTNFDDALLLTVFSYLPLADVVRASGVCRRWYRVSFDGALWKKADLRLFGKLLSDEDAFERFVHSRLSTNTHDVDLTGLVLTEKNLNSIAVHCKNLRRLTLRCVTFKTDCDSSGVDNSLVLIPKKLVSLDISFARGTASIFSRIASQLHSCIKSLGVCDGFLRATMASAKLESTISRLADSLENLDMSQCLMLKDSLLEVFACCKKLKVLSVRKCSGVFGKSLQLLLRNSSLLETLVLDGTSVEGGVLEMLPWEELLVLKHIELGWCSLLNTASLKIALPRIAQIPSLQYLGLCNIGQGNALTSEVFESFAINLRKGQHGSPVQVKVDSSLGLVNQFIERLNSRVPQPQTSCEVSGRQSRDFCARVAPKQVMPYSFTSQFPVPKYDLETPL